MALILIVDDSPTEVFQMRKALEQAGFRIEAAADGAEAIRKAREMHPDLILMDIVMPGMDGFRATRTLSNDPETRSIPVIMVTSKANESDRVWGMRQGAVDFLVKPVTPAQLREKAQAALLAS
ncbi:MAG: twitching motility two-component system response regulator PilH [Proteobacteria bacterium]|jgi:twitching motility two-component system response regulator PilH|nr:twitching motility two-component system response regulator PilH [Pseudomonadota bacterium]